MVEYDPGKCNIGAKERNNRYIIGASGIIAAVLSVGLTVYYTLPSYVLVFSFIPLFLGFEGVFQAVTGFCVHYAQKGVYEDNGELEEVESQEDHRADMNKAKKIHFASLLSATIATIMIYIALA